MKDVIKAPNDVLQIYKEGYRPPWEKPPPATKVVENNKSAKVNDRFLWEEIQRLLKLDCIEETKYPSKIMHPWSVVYSKKMRALLDASRNANPYIKKIKTRFADLSKVSEMIKPNWYYAVDDFDSGYWQVPLAPDQYKFFGCSAVNPSNGRVHFFYWKVLFLGINDAARVFTDLCTPVIKYCRVSLGIDSSIYIDDLLTGGNGLENSTSNRKKVKQVFRKAGWLFSESKGRDPSQQFLYLGFIADTVEMKFKIPEEKKAKVLKLIQDLFNRKHKKVPVKFVASVAGNIISLARAIGPVSRLMTRNLYVDISKAASWKVCIRISKFSVKELEFWLDHLTKLKGFPIIPSLSQNRITYNLNRVKNYDFHSAGDASAYAGFGAELSLEGETLVQFNFSEEEMKKSSTYRELRVIEEMYLSDKAHKFAGSKVLHSCDNLNISRILEHGSRNPELLVMVKRIYLRCVDLGIQLDAEWRPRTDPLMVWMDKGSKEEFFPADEFSLGFDDFLRLSNIFGPFDLDLLASSFNKKATKYFSKGFDFTSQGFNMFQQKLYQEINYYALPPPNLALKVLLHLQKFQAKGLVLLPLWPAASWFCTIFPEGHLPNFVKSFLIFKPFFLAHNQATSGVFRGNSSFDCIALQVNFNNLTSEISWEPVFHINNCIKKGCFKCV